jgi:hypothetical protein
VRISRNDGNDVLVPFPITSRQPSRDRFAAEIPAMEKRRAGPDATLRLWIILDEYNQDVIGRSFYLGPEPPLGRFSKAFFLPLMKEFIVRAPARAGSIAAADCGRTSPAERCFSCQPKPYFLVSQVFLSAMHSSTTSISLSHGIGSRPANDQKSHGEISSMPVVLKSVRLRVARRPPYKSPLARCSRMIVSMRTCASLPRVRTPP